MSISDSELWERIRHILLGSFYNEVASERFFSIGKPFLLLKKEVALTPSAEVERLWKKLSDLDEQLEVEKADFENFRNECDFRWEMARERSMFLLDASPKLDLYIKGLEVAKRRYRQRELKERMEVEMKTAEISRLESELKHLEKIKEQTYARLKNFEFLKSYLNTAADENEEKFRDVKQLVLCFEDVLKTKRSFSKKILDNVTQRVDRTVHIKEKQKNKEDQIVAAALYLDESKVYAPKLKQSALMQEDALIMAKDKTKTKCMTIGQLKFGIRNLYILLCNQMKQSITLKEDDFPNQLHFVEKYLHEVEKLKKKGRIALESSSDAVVIPKSYYEEKHQKLSTNSPKKQSARAKEKKSVTSPTA